MKILLVLLTVTLPKLVVAASLNENQVYGMCSASLAYESQLASNEAKETYIQLAKLYLNMMDVEYRPNVAALLDQMLSGKLEKDKISQTAVTCIKGLKQTDSAQ